jgi:hypothetical protein
MTFWPSEVAYEDVAIINDGIDAICPDGMISQIMRLASRLVDQLIQYQGCCERSHQQLLEEHIVECAEHDQRRVRVGGVRLLQQMAES